MAIAQIKITYRQIIDVKAETTFEKNVFYTSYNEFLSKSPVYNVEEKFKTFTQMVKNDDRANALNYTLNLSIMHFLDDLKREIPVLKDTLGRSIAFDTPEFILIESDLFDESAHCCAIDYTTNHLILHKIIGEYLLLSVPATNPDSRTEQANTFMLQLQPNLALTSYQEYQTKMVSDFTGFAAN